jgi:hypothetical protein
VVRKLRRSADTRGRLPEAYTYNGSSADADRWVKALAAETGDFAHRPIGLASTTPRRARRRSDTIDDAIDAATATDAAIDAATATDAAIDAATATDATVGATSRVNGGGGGRGGRGSGGDHGGSGGGHGGGGRGGGDWLDGPDEFGLIILAVIALLVVVVIAAPLGLIAIEIVLTLGLAAVGIVLRLANIKPWTVLVLRDRTVVAAVAVKGWRSSRSVITALRQHTA